VTRSLQGDPRRGGSRSTRSVVSRTLEDADAWQNSILLRGDAVDTVADLKEINIVSRSF
jgi:hypothetical protein